MTESTQPESGLINSHVVLKQMWTAMRLLGLDSPKRHRIAYYAYSIFLNSIVTFYYPLSMFINMFLLETKSAVLANLTLTMCVIICSIKTFNNYLKRHELYKIRDHLTKLDSNVKYPEEKIYLNYILKRAQLFFKIYALMYGSVAASCELPEIVSKEKRLMYPAWFPFDWKSSTTLYILVHAYQFVGIYIQIYQNLLSDSLPGTLLWLLKGHMHALGLRVKRIGLDETKTNQENYQELVKCIKVHKICIEYFNSCQIAISNVMILQFICTEGTLCATAIYIFFVGDNLFEVGYLSCYFISMILEITLTCYCGSELQAESQKFTTALYSCNWMTQDLRFRKILIIFMQNSQSSWTVFAGGVVSVTLATWLAVLKTTYSLFAVFNQLT